MNQSYKVHLHICSICHSKVKRTLNIGGFIGVHGGLIITACALTRQAVVFDARMVGVMITLSPPLPHLSILSCLSPTILINKSVREAEMKLADFALCGKL